MVTTTDAPSRMTGRQRLTVFLLLGAGFRPPWTSRSYVALPQLGRRRPRGHRAAVGGHGVRVTGRRVHVAVRASRGPLRPAQALPRRDRAAGGVVTRRWLRDDSRDAADRPRAAGLRHRDHPAVRSGVADHGVQRREAASAGAGTQRCAPVRRVHRRCARRRHARRPAVLALGVPDQRAGGRAHPGGHAVRGAREPRSRGGEAGRAGRGLGDSRPAGVRVRRPGPEPARPARRGGAPRTVLADRAAGGSAARGVGHSVPADRERGNVAGLIVFSMEPGLIYLMTLYLQDVLHFAPLTTGLIFGVPGLASVVSGVVAGRFIGRYGARTVLAVGLLGQAAFTAPLVLLGTGNAWLAVLVPALFFGFFGHVTVIVSFMVTATSGVPDSEQGLASGLAPTLTQQVGITIGIPILGAVAATQASLLSGIQLALTVNVLVTVHRCCTRLVRAATRPSVTHDTHRIHLAT